MDSLANAFPVWIPTVIATAILIAGVVDDLRSRKFHNWLFLVCTGCAFLVVALVGGIAGTVPAFLGFLCGVIVMLPLVLLRVIGAGDLKLLAAFGAATTWNAVISVAFLALFWGAVFGVVRAIANGQGLALARNMKHLLMVRQSEGLVLHRIPYSVALLVGWLSYLTVGGVL